MENGSIECTFVLSPELFKGVTIGGYGSTTPGDSHVRRLKYISFFFFLCESNGD